MPLSISVAVNNQVVKQTNNVLWQANMNAQNAMEQAYDADQSFSFLVQYFGSQLGYEAVAIDNIASQAGTDAFLFWEFSVNGVIADKGVDHTSPKDGDKLGWNFTRYDPAKHDASRYAAIKKAAE